MKFRAIAAGVALAIAAVSFAWAQEGRTAAPPRAPVKRIVMTWVPPYAIAASQTQLTSLFGGFGPANALTHLALQFWKPTAAGGLTRVTPSSGTITDAKVTEFVTWGHSNGVKVLLTVFNGDGGWDWAAAKNAFATHRGTFTKALVKEMQRLNLDGIDVDFEGPEMTPTTDDQTTYVAFVAALTKAVHKDGKVVNVNSFSYIWNAPNQSWWADLFPHVDSLNSMGYESIGINGPTWQAYAAQRAAAGKNVAKLILGVPSYESVWLGDDAVTQIQWFVGKKQKLGVGIWDAQNSVTPWQTAPIWSRLKQIRDQ
jgi:GH18 family chitinase